LRSASQASHVTSAVGLEETAGRQRARRTSLFTQTLVWVTGLICLAFLLGSLVQAWSNSHFMQELQQAQQTTQQLEQQHQSLEQQAIHYSDPYVIESEARQQLNYGRAGEHEVAVVGGQQQGQASSSQPTNQPTAQNFWQAWWDLFWGNG
jgi:cell division protein FtsB